MDLDSPEAAYEGMSNSDSAPLLPMYIKDSSSDFVDARRAELYKRLKLRRINKDDLQAVKQLCFSSFPIQYPECWFDEVVSSNALISYGFFDVGGRHLCALIVAEVKPLGQCNVEDREIVVHNPSAHVVYILSLAVDEAYRRMGLASRLLQHLFDVAVFLHVLSTNYQAIKFYKSNDFILHDTLLNYYRFDDGFGDGCTYVRYTNGARPPLSMQEMCRYVTNAFCYPARVLYKMFAHS